MQTGSVVGAVAQQLVAQVLGPCQDGCGHLCQQAALMNNALCEVVRHECHNL